jgi:hypothetical protein
MNLIWDSIFFRNAEIFPNFFLKEQIFVKQNEESFEIFEFFFL